MKKKSNFILASQSPRRRQILKEAGYQFRIIPSHVKETFSKKLKPRQIVQHLSFIKAQAVAKAHPGHFVLGADTLVFLKNKTIGKPKNANHAKQMLKQLSGQWQRVYTGVALIWPDGKRKKTGYAVSYVKIRKLTKNDIERAAKKHLDKAGAYAIQEKNDPFVEKIRGDYDNVVGLPIRIVRKVLRGA